jgi:hypothetical protein
MYHSTIDHEHGKVKVTMSGLVDSNTLLKKLNKSGKSAALWEAKPRVVGQPQNLQLGGGDNGQPKDTDGKGQVGRAGGAVVVAGAGEVGAREANMVILPQQMQPLQQDLAPQQLQQHLMMQQMQM